ncbi:MAG: glucose-6-phosphate dehydrogenase assembly protein OpcA [Hamadaea sp.]|uniref:glucose-6-phosphate dehydrogenase assembly protein OpcA n=1 Tax=Hamadaea sp. NPDC050747 TaxID=3155789 RepID=UPI0017AEA9B9|nr:glucose-6-phosphate dehydrogenase assembly protein OpcA [Hamadaea sp.]NUR52733.1 glucose-6-phosphate dehydrogenase assembly protein OpcA [Hamadaea sp.]NUT07115.1 glucose-6-phosphate dehydrogenase assembly protein OpcA [Hamadaea sp.]
MLALWDTTGAEVVRKLAAERHSAGGVASGLALTLVVVVEEARVRAVEDAATIAAASHPCRLIVVSRISPTAGKSRPGVDPAKDRLDAEIIVGGRLGPAEAVVLRMHGGVAQHAESVVIPLLAPDVPVVTWWHGAPPDRIAEDPLGVVAERRITDVAQAADPMAALRQRAVDYAPGDTDLAWTRTTPWRTLLAGAFDTVAESATAVTVTAPEDDPVAALLSGWLCARLGVSPTLKPGARLDQVAVSLGDGSELSLTRNEGTAVLSRTGSHDRVLPLVHRRLGEELAEELRRLDADQIYAAALEAATGTNGLNERLGQRVGVKDLVNA